MKKTWTRVNYIGTPIMTRGDYGENVVSGRLSPDGEIFVWDSYFGWSSWGSMSSDWIATGELVESVIADY